MEQFVVINEERCNVLENSLDLSRKGLTDINDIKGLEELENLKALDLSFNEINEISNLEALKKLEDLDISNNKIKEIRCLDNLQNLKFLNLAYNQINEIKFLDNLQNLEELVLFANNISEIKNLLSLKNLKILRLDLNRINEISGLQLLENLDILSLSENRITEIKNLEKIVNLTNLDLSGNRLTEIKNLQTLINLKVLNLSKNRISRIDGLTNNIKLEELYLYINQIPRIEGFEHLKQLDLLYLFDNNINEIEGLDSLSNLTLLILSNNNIKKIKGLKNLIKLTRLELSQNNISIMEGFENLSNLEYLILYGNELTNIAGLELLKKLKGLNLDYNNISIITGLENLISLQSLSMTNNKIKRLSGIQYLTSLNELHLQNNEISEIGDISNISDLSRMVVNFLGNCIRNSKEYVKFLKKLLINVEIDFFYLSEIRAKDIPDLQNLIQKLIDGEKYGLTIWKNRIIKFSLDPEKENLDKIIHLYNTKLFLSKDLHDSRNTYAELLPFLKERVGLEKPNTIEFILYNIIKELFSAIKKVHTNKKINLIKNIQMKLKPTKQNNIKSIFSYSVSIINLVKSLLEYDIVKYNKHIFDLLNHLTGEDNDIVDFEKGIQKKINSFINPILHRIINLLLEKIKNQSNLLKTNKTSNFMENLKDHKVKNFFAQLRIEKINIDEPSDNLDEMRLYLAQMNLRLFMYDDKKANFKLENRGDIIEMIKENLRKSKTHNANVIIFPEYSFPEEIIPVLIEYSKKNNIWIIGGLERFESIPFNLSLKENATIIISPSSSPIIQKKHFRGKNEPELIPDNKIKIISSQFGTFCVLICADFLEDYLSLIIRDQIDFIVVPSFNRDVDSFEYSAFNKCFTVMSYIIICNIQKYDESKIFAPFRQNRVLEMANSSFIELNLNEFSLHRKRRSLSSQYKKPLSDTLYEMDFKSF